MTLLRKYALWLVLATLAGIAGAWLIHASLPVRYISTAEVDVEPSAAAVAANWAPNMMTEQEVATSGIVLTNAARAIGTTPSALARDLSATVSGTSRDGWHRQRPVDQLRDADGDRGSALLGRSGGRVHGFPQRHQRPGETQAHDPMIVTLVTAATLPAAPAGVGQGILLPTGAILGLLLGIGAIFVRDHVDHRVRDRADLERCLEAPVLGGDHARPASA